MLFTNESTDKAVFHKDTLRDRLLRRISGWNWPVKGIVRPAIGVAAYLALCLLFQAIAPDFHLSPGEWSWNLAGGVSFGFLLVFGLAYVPVVFVAYLIPLFADGSTAVSGWPVIVFALGNTAVFGSACYIARRVVLASDVDLEDRRTLIVVLTLIPFTAVVAASFSTMNWWFAGVVLPDAFLETLLIKAFGNGMGLLLVAPFVLLNGVPILNGVVARSNPLGVFRTGELAHGAALLHLAAGSVVAMGFLGLDRFDSYLLLFAPLIAMALRFGLRGLAASFLFVGCTKTAMAFLGYTALDGLFMETTILAALASNLIVATLATERTRAMNSARSHASLIMEAVARTKKETLETPEQEQDLNEALKHLVRNVEAAANLCGIENQIDESQAEHERLLERLEALIHDSDRGTETAGVPDGLGIRDLVATP